MTTEFNFSQVMRLCEQMDIFKLQWFAKTTVGLVLLTLLGKHRGESSTLLCFFCSLGFLQMQYNKSVLQGGSIVETIVDI